MIEFKKVIKALDGTYIEGDAKTLVRTLRNYPLDFTYETFDEVIQFSKATGYEDGAKILGWLVESLHEQAANKLDLGQIKIDVFENNHTEALTWAGIDECTIMRENDKVLIAITGSDDAGTWTAASAYSLEEFLALEEGTLDTVLGAIMYYNTQYEDYDNSYID